nr:hypothetical protein [Sphingomonas psychrotolerans]
MMIIPSPSVRPELVEGRLSTGTEACGALCFDKLSTNGNLK